MTSFFEKVWQDNADSVMKITNLNDWICNYCERRYGFISESAVKAWEILLATVYKSEFNNLGQGVPESIINARPALAIKAASTWGNAVVAYDKKALQKAAELLLVDYKHLQRSKGYSKLLITTWGSYNQCETGGLKDYSNRRWSGLIKDFYKPRWQRWINERIKELNGEPFEEKIAWFPWEWNWARQTTVYNVEPSSADILQLSKKILKHIK